MSFADQWERLPRNRLLAQASKAGAAAARASLGRGGVGLGDFANLISPAAAPLLPEMGARANQITQQRFGKVIRLFAPLYLSNECVNNCKYCGFSRDNAILRVTLTLEEVRRAASEALRPDSAALAIAGPPAAPGEPSR